MLLSTYFILSFLMFHSVFQVTAIFKEFGVTNITVQVEKEEFFQHMSGLSATFDQMLEMTHQIQAIPSQDDLYDIKAV